MELYRNFRPPAPRLTEKNLPDQAGKVFIVTGATSGVGEELVKILYSHNAAVYVAARSEAKGLETIQKIQTACPGSQGAISFLHLDLSDLTTIKKSASEFLSHESRLDVLWLNAGVMVPPQGSKTSQGYELQLGTNNLGHFLFVQYLRPILTATARQAMKDSVRVIWVSSSAVGLAPKPPIDFSNMDYGKDESAWIKYGRSKAGTVLYAVELARRAKEAREGVLSLSLNPGNLKSGLQRHMSKTTSILTDWVLHPPIYGAYTELFAGLSSEITAINNAAWVAPWGRISEVRKDLTDPELANKYWEWSEQQILERLREQDGSKH